MNDIKTFKNPVSISVELRGMVAHDPLIPSFGSIEPNTNAIYVSDVNKMYEQVFIELRDELKLQKNTDIGNNKLNSMMRGDVFIDKIKQILEKILSRQDPKYGNIYIGTGYNIEIKNINMEITYELQMKDSSVFDKKNNWDGDNCLFMLVFNYDKILSKQISDNSNYNRSRNTINKNRTCYCKHFSTNSHYITFRFIFDSRRDYRVSKSCNRY